MANLKRFLNGSDSKVAKTPEKQKITTQYFMYSPIPTTPEGLPKTPRDPSQYAIDYPEADQRAYAEKCRKSLSFSSRSHGRASHRQEPSTLRINVVRPLGEGGIPLATSASNDTSAKVVVPAEETSKVHSHKEQLQTVAVSLLTTTTIEPDNSISRLKNQASKDESEKQNLKNSSTADLFPTPKKKMTFNDFENYNPFEITPCSERPVTMGTLLQYDEKYKSYLKQEFVKCEEESSPRIIKSEVCKENSDPQNLRKPKENSDDQCLKDSWENLFPTPKKVITFKDFENCPFEVMPSSERRVTMWSLLQYDRKYKRISKPSRRKRHKSTDSQ